MDNGPIRSRIHYQDHTDVLTNVTDQPSEDLILERNAQLRNNPGAYRELGEGKPGGSWGRYVANIPFIMLEKAVRDGFNLNAPDSDTRSKELFRFLQSDEGKKCLIREKL